MAHLKRYRLVLCLLAGLFSTGCDKKPQSIESSEKPAASPHQSSGSTLIYQITSQFPLEAPVSIKDQAYRFFLDTGCTLSILNLTHRDLLGQQAETVTSLDPLLRARRVNRYAIPEDLAFYLGRTKFAGTLSCQDFADFGSPFHEFDGIIGMDYLQHTVFQIDWITNKISLHFNRSDLDNTNWGTAFTIITPNDNADPYLQLKLTDTISETFLVDTGSDQIYISQDTFAQLMKELFPEKEYIPTSIKTQTTSRHALDLKNASLQGTPLNTLKVVENPRAILGMEFFKQYNLVTFDFPNKKLYLK